jgi:GMP synthase-like glutamine amidotransferase
MRDGAVLIIQHQAIGHPGTILETLIADGVDFDLRQLHGRAPLPEPEELGRYRAFIVLGGSMNTDQDDVYPFLSQERRLLAEALRIELPLLGICLGAQQLACVDGGCVFERVEPAVGWMPIRLVGRDILFEGVPEEFMALEWHAQSFTVPGHACPLAVREDDEGGGVQAFRAGRRAWGLQFHPEIDAGTLEVWLKRDNKGMRERAPHVLERLHEQRDEIAMVSRSLCALLVRNLLKAADQPDAAEAGAA